MQNSNSNTYKYPWTYKLNFLPGVLFVSFFLYLVSQSRSEDKIYGYIIFGVILAFFILLVFLDKRKIAGEIHTTDEAIIAKRKYKNDNLIEWQQIESLKKEGSSYSISTKKKDIKMYAIVIAKNNKRIVIRREINNYNHLLSVIETKTGKRFEDF